MTNLFKRLGVGLAAAALLLGLAGLHASGTVQAQNNPDGTYTGTVTIDGEDAPSGTEIRAMQGDTLCATGQTGRGVTGGAIDANRYALTIREADCSGTISFMVGEAMAAETAPFSNTGLNTVNLTATSAMATEEPEEPGDGAMDGDDDGDEPAPPPAETATPTDGDTMAAPDTGSGLASSGSSATTTLAAALGALALVTMLGGYALARRRS